MNEDLYANPLAGKITPPAGLLRKLCFYGKRSGYLYAAMSFLGRRYPRLWSIFGPVFSRGNLKTWLKQPAPHVLNLGGGSNLFERWLTADVDPRADVYIDITKCLPLADESLDVVYLEEVIEHISRDACKTLLNECLRILKVDGFLRLTTPDLDAFAGGFDGSKAFEVKFNEIFYGHGHKCIYSRLGVRSLLEAVGFSSITQSSFRDRDSHFGYFDTHAYRFAISESSLTQYWEAQKLKVIADK